MRQAVREVPRQIEIVIIPPMNKLGIWVGEFMHPMPDIAERDCGDALVHNADARMFDT
jgi:hypothetical protein